MTTRPRHARALIALAMLLLAAAAASAVPKGEPRDEFAAFTKIDALGDDVPAVVGAAKAAFTKLNTSAAEHVDVMTLYRAEESVLGALLVLSGVPLDDSEAVDAARAQRLAARRWSAGAVVSESLGVLLP